MVCFVLFLPSSSSSFFVVFFPSFFLLSSRFSSSYSDGVIWLIEFIRKKHFCGVVAESDEIKSSILYVRFFATDAGMGSKFTLLYTAYRKKDSNNGTSQCTADEFDCDDDSCIDASLQCDGYANCKFKKDEQGCTVRN